VLIGIFKPDIGIFSLKFITFLVGSIAFGRIMSSLILMNQDFFNTYFIFEIFAFTSRYYINKPTKEIKLNYLILGYTQDNLLEIRLL